jgi:hypothetical protein
LSFERWKYVRDGLADLWEWWCDCAHLRPQVKTDRWKKSVIEPPFVDELIRWAAPLTAEENEALPLESATSIDAHLGDALCQICAMAHFYIAVNEGLEQIEPGKLEYVESGRKRKYQRLAKYDQIELVLFSPGGEDIKPDGLNPLFKHYCARINSAFGSPLRQFPSRAILRGMHLARADLTTSSLISVRLNTADLFAAHLGRSYLHGANLSRANLNNASLHFSMLICANLSGASLNSADLFGASLNFANLSGANLSGANLSSVDLSGAVLSGAYVEGAIGLTREQIESAWIDERTALPEDLEKVKPAILERQRLLMEPFKGIGTLSTAPEVVVPEK